MAKNLPKWDEQRTETLENFVQGADPVTQGQVKSAAEQLETSARSVSSKLRKLGYNVETVGSAKSKKFSEDDERTLAKFLEENSGKYTYAEIAEKLGGEFNAKQIQGKILSMELTEYVKLTPKPESTKTFTDDEESKFKSLVENSSFIEDIAKSMDKSINTIRGKALSMLRSGEIEAIPKKKETAKADPFESLSKNVSEMTVEEIANAIDKTPRGVRAMLTRRGISSEDYDGAGKKAKKEN